MSWSPEFYIGELRPWPDAVPVVRVCTGKTRRYVPERTCGMVEESRRYVPEPPHCTMEPDGYWQEEYGYVTCSNCGEVWCFECDGPKQHRWTCCPHCQAIIDYGEDA